MNVVVSEQIFLAEILLMDMRFLPFVQCSNRSRGWGFALRPCLRNVRDMHWTGPRCPCKMMVFVIQNSEFLSLAKSVIQNSDYLIVRCMCHWIHLLGRWTKMNSWNLLQVERRRWPWTGDSFLPLPVLVELAVCLIDAVISIWRCLHRTCWLIRVP